MDSNTITLRPLTRALPIEQLRIELGAMVDDNAMVDYRPELLDVLADLDLVVEITRAAGQMFLGKGQVMQVERDGRAWMVISMDQYEPAQVYGWLRGEDRQA